MSGLFALRVLRVVFGDWWVFKRRKGGWIGDYLYISVDASNT